MVDMPWNQTKPYLKLIKFLLLDTNFLNDSFKKTLISRMTISYINRESSCGCLLDISQKTVTEFTRGVKTIKRLTSSWNTVTTLQFSPYLIQPFINIFFVYSYFPSFSFEFELSSTVPFSTPITVTLFVLWSIDL